ncbi:MAG: adenylate/guanylate cyclase domain-containing protein [Deltaproteobacteria bacterium]|nr:MAG: adenylate/guanylate cyclase domain-containing protein [Deltaproteobacteria bacterium]
MSVQEHSFELRTEVPAARLWPLLSDTDLTNRLLGRPAVEYRYEPQPDGTTRVIGSYREMGVLHRYVESRFEWRYGRLLDLERHFEAGAMRRFRMRLELDPEGGHLDRGGCRVRVHFEAEARAPFGPLLWLVTRTQVVPGFKRLFGRWIEALARGEDPQRLRRAGLPDLPDPEARPLPHGVRAQIAERARPLEARHDPALVRALVDTIAGGSPLDLHRMRPRAYARQWGTEEEATLALFFDATREGLLRMRWDVICPHCRSAAEGATTLAEIEEKAACAGCNLRFDVDLSRSLEAVFQPHPALRATKEAKFCALGPGSNTHVYLRLHLSPGATAEVPLELPPGRYRLRTTTGSHYQYLNIVDGDADRPLSLRIGESGLVGDDQVHGAWCTEPVPIHNESARPALLFVETGAWLTDALPASELVVSQRFRDLFSSEVLSPGVRLSVEKVAIVFTDLVSSTAMYRTLGDGAAFKLVWSHFDGLKAVIAREGGTLVKTIGDAVMAAFPDPERALRAALDFQHAAEEATRALGYDWKVGLKIGLAAGPALVVNLNDRLDFFGTTVNLAARVQGASRAGEVLVDGRTAAELPLDAIVDARWARSTDAVDAKGFTGKVEVVRLARRHEAEAAPSAPTDEVRSD